LEAAKKKGLKVSELHIGQSDLETSKKILREMKKKNF
jgi:aspartate/methionine/tyrosine aminotransferase